MSKKERSDLLEIVAQKMRDAESGLEIDFDPDEAELAAAFVESAMSEEDALESMIDRPEAADDGADLALVFDQVQLIELHRPEVFARKPTESLLEVFTRAAQQRTH